MATSKVQIGNLALANLGSKNTIESFTEESTEASLINTWYDHCRQFLLEAVDWNFARKRLILATSSEDPPSGIWAYRYGYPSDCVVAREIENSSGGTEGDAIPFEIEFEEVGDIKTILTDMQDATLIYTKNITDPSLFPSSFIHALAAFLAANMAFPLTGKTSTEDKMWRKYQFLMAQAGGNNLNEAVKPPPRLADWTRKRNA